jgi:CheY-like chemotaxis protein/two-component sensor histidine kinase
MRATSTKSDTSLILVVDDNEPNRAIIGEILSDDYELLFASDGEGCLKQAAQSLPDLILLDIMMPDIDGYEVCRRIRASSALGRTKIIMISAKVLPADRIKGYEAGANDYLTKPFEEDELLAKVRVFLALKSAEEVQDARLAGMADIARGVLHNVGNVLNSVNISAANAHKSLRGARIEDLTRIAETLQGQDDIASFIAQDARGSVLPTMLGKLGEHYSAVRDDVMDELVQLKKNIEHIQSIIRLQQRHAKGPDPRESVHVSELIEDALQLTMASIERHGIDVKTTLKETPSIVTDKHNVLQILVNLILNAKDAIVEAGTPEPAIQIVVSSESCSTVKLSVKDNGIGIAGENIRHLFQQGFSTKKQGNGLGLHSCAMAATALGGSLTCSSDGPNLGATFVLELPLEQ